METSITRRITLRSFAVMLDSSVRVGGAASYIKSSRVSHSDRFVLLRAACCSKYRDVAAALAFLFRGLAQLRIPGCLVNSILGLHWFSVHIQKAKCIHRAVKSVNVQPSCAFFARSEERRVGKECRSRWS